ncbi:MAG: dihydroorotase family protein [Firmicutes bacterium]|nr:dihydroorotase family protein [Bacillota bacterium]
MAKPLDPLLLDGLVIDSRGRRRASVGILDGRIAGLYLPGTEPPARAVIDVAGKAILPGVIDPPRHHREPGFEYKEDIESATRACAAGGVTTTVAMPNVYPPPTTLERLEQMFERYRAKAVVDWNINPSGTVLEEIPKMAARGVPAIKIFMVEDTGREYPHMPGIGVHDHGKLMAIMQACAAAGIPLMVHPHDQELMSYIEQQFWSRGERDALAYARAYAAYDGIIWETAIALLLRLQRATGVHLHILHVQTAESVRLIREAKARGQRVPCEINPWALFLGHDWANIERLGSYALSYWVPEHNVPVLWDALKDGTIDIVAPDHAPHTRQEKEIGWTDGWKAHTGTPSAQFYLSLFLDAAHRGLISYERVVEALSEAPARIFDLRRKGRIDVGRDADLVVADLQAEHRITDDEVLSKIGYTPYADRTVRGVPVRTLVRGKTVYADGKVVGTRGTGQMAVARVA